MQNIEIKAEFEYEFNVLLIPGIVTPQSLRSDIQEK